MRRAKANLKRASQRLKRVSLPWNRTPSTGDDQEDTKTHCVRVAFQDEQIVKEVLAAPPSAEDVPEYFLLLNDSGFNSISGKVLDALSLGTKARLHQSIEIYNFSATRSQAFAQRFTGREPKSGDFVPGILYRFLRVRYVPCYDYAMEFTLEQVDEVLYLLHNAGAAAIIIDKTQYDKMSEHVRASLEAKIPAHVAGVDVVGGELTVEQSTDTSGRTAVKYTRNFSDRPAFKPHVDTANLDFTWFYRRGLLHNELRLLLSNIEKHDDGFVGHGGTCSTFNMVSSGDQQTVFDLQGNVCKVVGFGARRQHEWKSESDFSFDVRFFSVEDMKAVEAYSETSRSRQTLAVRRSVSGLATLRAEFMDVRAHMREDIYIANRRGVPVSLVDLEENGMVDEEELQAASDAQTKAFAAHGDDDSVPPPEKLAEMKRHAVEASEACKPGGKTITLLFSLFGPQGGGRSSLVYTWRLALLYSTASYYTHGADLWREMRHSAEYAGFVAAVKFDPTLRSGHNARSLQRVDDAAYTQLKPKNQARVFINDLPPARDAATDDDTGLPLPFGIQILVLDYLEVAKLYDKAADDEADEAAQKEAEQTVKDNWEKFCGELYDDPNKKEDPGKKAQEKRGKIKRYPPMVTLLSKCSVEEPDGRRERVCDWLSGLLHLKWVLAVPTFKPPSEAETKDFMRRRRDTRGIEEKWQKCALQSLDALSTMIRKTAEHEQAAVARFLHFNPENPAPQVEQALDKINEDDDDDDEDDLL